MRSPPFFFSFPFSSQLALTGVGLILQEWDDVSEPREKIFNIPLVIVALLLAFIGVHLVRSNVSPEVDLALLRDYAFVPGRFTFAFDKSAVAGVFSDGSLANTNTREIARYFLSDGKANWLSVVSYAFLHGDWNHLGLNSMWLTAFGAAVARRFGALRFLAFFVVTAIGGALVHYLAHRAQFTPMIGASAVVSGAMGAAVRFVFQPGAPLGESLRHSALGDDGAYRQPALPLSQVLSDKRVFGFLAIWFVVNFIFGVFSSPLGLSDAPIAWEAHVGGFLAGLLLFRFFDPHNSFSS